MKIEMIRLQNFRCFGEQVELKWEEVLTTLVGGNGSGKTAVMQAVSRLFGTSQAQRRIQRRDFHIPADRNKLLTGDKLYIEAIFVFPELSTQDESPCDAIPEFFNQMSVSEEGGLLKVRIRLQATWTDDGTSEGAIDEEIRWIRSLSEDFTWEECPRVQAAERSSIQFIYMPANRDATIQVTSLLKGRLWQAAKWSPRFKNKCIENTEEIQDFFAKEEPSNFILERLSMRWQELYKGDTDRTPCLQLIENRFDEFIRKAEFTFIADEEGHERRLSELSDGQRSLFHIALTAATLEAEQDAFALSVDTTCFEQDKLHRVYLTILAIEEPENSLSPFFLSRIIKLAREIGEFPSAQVLLSSHSPAILGRIEPEEVRYLRLNRDSRNSSIRKLTLPDAADEASRYVRLAVKAYPELYFARFVILGEGDSERIVIPCLAEKMDISLDPSFVPVIPLGGRFVHYFWRLLNDLGIPYATLLDLDLGRKHGGMKIIMNTFQNLEKIQNKFWENTLYQYREITPDTVNRHSDQELLNGVNSNWLKAFQENGIFFSFPLDIDFAMLRAFPTKYHILACNERGPRDTEISIKNKKEITLKEQGNPDIYNQDYDDTFKWYPYLFLNRSKPETHRTALSAINKNDVAFTPDELKALINYVKDKLNAPGDKK